MEYYKNLIPVKGAISGGGELIPIWEFILKEEREDDGGYEYFHHKETGTKVSFYEDFKNLVYDVNSKKLSTGEKIFHKKDGEVFKVGDEIFIIDGYSNPKKLKRSSIIEVIKEEQIEYINFGKEIKQLYPSKYDSLEDNVIYTLYYYTYRYVVTGSKYPIRDYDVYIIK